MGVVAVLHPQNLINDRFNSSSMRKNPRNPNYFPPNSNPPRRHPNFAKSEGRKRSPTGLRRNRNNPMPAVPEPAAKNSLVMGQVKILKRGEALKEQDLGFEKQKSSKVVGIDDFALSSRERLGPEPEMVPKQMKKNFGGFFAGTAFVDSPPPSSVPLPGFFTKKFVSNTVKEDTSSDLRRLLGLDLS